MKANILYLVATIIGVVLAGWLFSYLENRPQETPIPAAALPTNGLFTSEDRPRPAKNTGVAETLPAPATPKAPSEVTDDVPAGAEISGDAASNALPAPADAAVRPALPASEGQ